MRDVGHAALVITHRDLGMMILAMRNPRGGVDERHRLVIIFEGVVLGDDAVDGFPSVELLQQFRDFIVAQRRYTAFARFAFAFCQIDSGHKLY